MAPNDNTSSTPPATTATSVPILFCAEYKRPARNYSEHDRQMMVKLKEAVGPLDEEGEAFVTDSTLHRYLRARKFDLGKATDMLKATLTWRKTYRPTEIDPEEMIPEAESGKAYVNGFDKEGRPILILTSARETTKTYERQVKHVVFVFERLVQIMPPDVEQVVVLANFTGFNLMTSPPLHVARSFLDILGSHYPERLGYAICQNAPMLWWPVFSMIKPFLDPVTAAKIKFLDSKHRADLEELIDLAQLENRLGGHYNFEWDFPTYWKHILAFPNKPDTNDTTVAAAVAAVTSEGDAPASS